jgi:hypothetical protein
VAGGRLGVAFTKLKAAPMMMNKSRLCFAALALVLAGCGASSQGGVRWSIEPSEVQSASRAPAAPPIPSRILLVEGRDDGDASYGMYSYILIARRPDTPAKFDRAKALIARYWTLNRTADYLASRSADASSLNAIYALLDKAPPSNLEGMDADVRAKWIVDNYDYTRASAFLSKALPDLTSKEGPVLLCSTIPLHRTDTTAREGKGFHFDLSDVPNDVVVAWTDAFIEQTTRTRFWEGSGNWALEIRTALSRVTVNGILVHDAMVLLTRYLSDVKSFTVKLL